MISVVPSPKLPGMKLIGSAGASHPLSQCNRDPDGQGSEMWRGHGLGCGVLLEHGTSTPLIATWQGQGSKEAISQRGSLPHLCKN